MPSDYASNSIEDRHGDGVVSNGVWSVFTATNPDVGKLPLEADTVYLAILAGDTPMYFKVAGISLRSLELAHLDRGGTLEFRRVE